MLMPSIVASTRDYDNWLRDQIGPAFVEADLDRKHGKMQKNVFCFLRATYWRWAETILQICPDLARAPEVLSIGDIHLENFGTWRDAESRLIWGVNDFDEAAVMPYPLDLVRLATSALLARGKTGLSPEEICTPLLEGYRKGIDKPCPFVLERNHKWLRKAVMLPEVERAEFWRGFAELQETKPPADYDQVLISSMPKSGGMPSMAARTAGTGSLGRPRFVARLEWKGGPLIREAKAIVLSAWSRHYGATGKRIHMMEIAEGHWRAPDPHYRLVDMILVRRISPNSRKIEVGKSTEELLQTKMLEAMGHEIANCQANQDGARMAILADLKRCPQGWLPNAAKAAAQAIERDFREFR